MQHPLRQAGSWLLIPALLLMTGLIIAAGTPPQDPAPLSWQQDILPAMEQSCAACHLTGDEAGGLILAGDEAYATLMQNSWQLPTMKLVEPGNSADSYLYLKMTGDHVARGGSGMRMPVGGRPADARFLSLLKQWIAQGAQP